MMINFSLQLHSLVISVLLYDNVYGFSTVQYSVHYPQHFIHCHSCHTPTKIMTYQTCLKKHLKMCYFQSRDPSQDQDFSTPD